MLSKILIKRILKKNTKRIGRGAGSGKGKTCSRGTKGQLSRSGVSLFGFCGGQTPIYLRVPKRGFNKKLRIKYSPINIDKINKLVYNEL